MPWGTPLTSLLLRRVADIVRDLPHDMAKTLESLLRDETPLAQSSCRRAT